MKHSTDTLPNAVRPRRRLSSIVRISVSVLLLTLLVWIHHRSGLMGVSSPSGEAWQQKLLHPHLGWLFVLVALQMMAVLCGSARWRLLLNRPECGFWFCLRQFLEGRFFGAFTPSTLGLDGYRSVQTIRHLKADARKAEAAETVAAAMLVEKLLGLIGMAIITLCFAPMPHVVRALALLSCSIALMLNTKFAAQLPARLVQSKPGAFVKRALQHIENTSRTTRVLGVALGCVTHLSLAASYGAAARALSVAASATNLNLVWIGNQIQLGLLAPISIAGLGVREAIAVQGFSALGVPMAEAISVTTLTFLATQLPAIVGGLLLLVSRETSKIDQ